MNIEKAENVLLLYAFLWVPCSLLLCKAQFFRASFDQGDTSLDEVCFSTIWQIIRNALWMEILLEIA